MTNDILNALAAATPALRQRYLQRVRGVPGPEARKLEAQIRELVERDQGARAA